MNKLNVSLSRQGDLVKISPNFSRSTPRKQYGGVRAAITKFSQRSRKNMLEKFAIIDKQRAGGATFVTLTYASIMQDDKRAYEHLRSLLRRIDYEIERSAKGGDTWYPVRGKKQFYCWRKEDQERGAIHFHLMAFGVRWLDREWLANSWSEIIGESVELFGSDGSIEKSPVFTRVEFCRSVKKTWYYLSKYLAKDTGEEKEEKEGEIPPASEFNAVLGRPLELVGEGRPESVVLTSVQIRRNRGRWWGWENRKNIPFAEKVVAHAVVTFEEYRRFRWDVRRMEEWTWKVNLADTLKMFIFTPAIDIIEIFMAGLEGRPIFDHVMIN